MTVRSIYRPASLSAALATAALLLSSPAFAKNDAGNCHYFSDFVATLKQAHDAGKTKDETVALARAKAKTDQLDGPTADLFAGEGIGFYYPQPEYTGTMAQVHDQAYANCMAGKLP